jgi:3-hydroxybutyryl-CoA dehydrogenase
MKVGVVGAGVMGTGVAHSAARAGHEVALVDRSLSALSHAVDQIRRDCRLSGLVTGTHIDVGEVLGRVTTSQSIASLHDCELVVENVTESWDEKRSVYMQLDDQCGDTAVFVANTSAIPITRIASVTARPDRVIGVHFMNPVPMKPAAELIRGRHTSDETARRTEAFLASMGKVGIPVNDACGFVSNRVLMLTVNEAAFLVYEGVASADTVDEVFRSCFGHPMGPLETADLIGVDTILYSVEVLYEHFADSKYRPCPLLREMTAAGLHGRKTGQGFYIYDTGGHASPNSLPTATPVPAGTSS